MGLTTLELEIANVARLGRTEKLEFPVDSGAIYSVVPAPVGSVWVPPVYSSPR